MSLLISIDIFFAVKLYIIYKNRVHYSETCLKMTKSIQLSEDFVFPVNLLLQHLYISNRNPKQRRLVKFQVLRILLTLKINISKEGSFSSLNKSILHLIC